MAKVLRQIRPEREKKLKINMARNIMFGAAIIFDEHLHPDFISNHNEFAKHLYRELIRGNPKLTKLFEEIIHNTLEIAQEIELQREKKTLRNYDDQNC